MTVQELKEMVDEFFSDTSRSQQETRAGLEEVGGHIEILCGSLSSEEE